MSNFRHYILTRFNYRIYDYHADKINMSPDRWMRHRIDLFKAITLPSMIGQTCQNFTWMLLFDPKTPKHFIDEIYAIDYPNIKILDKEYSGDVWVANFHTTKGDAITTRIDNDDAFDIHTIEAIQTSYEKDQSPRVIIFPYGYIIELAGRKLFIMEYWSNNCPTLIQPASVGNTVYQWDHSKIHFDPNICKEYIKDRSYWLQTVHSQNLLNSLNPTQLKQIRLDMPMKLSTLTAFNIDPDTLPVS